MKYFWCTLAFLVLVVSNVNAQCSNQLPPKPWGDDRPATECELLFYRSTYPQIINAFKRVENYFSTNYIASNNNPDHLMSMEDLPLSQVSNSVYMHNLNVGINSEKKFFQDIQKLNWSYTVKSNDNAYTKAYDELANLFGEKGVDAYYKELLLKVGYDNMGKDPKICRAKELENALDNSFGFIASMKGINVPEDKFANSHASFELLNIKNCAYAIRVIKNKTITDAGDAEQADRNNHIDELHLYIGKWKAPQIIKDKGFTVQNNFNLSQSKLSVQNILIVIKCTPELQEEVMKQIDIVKLSQLIN
jgi:hypothetical protein